LLSTEIFAKERARFPADFAVTAKEHQLHCALKSPPTLEFVSLLLDLPDAVVKTHYTHSNATHTTTDFFRSP
jgi:hypothetical protein